MAQVYGNSGAYLRNGLYCQSHDEHVHCLSLFLFWALGASWTEESLLGAVYAAQVFTSNQTLLLRFSLLFTCVPAPLKLQTFEIGFQSAIF